MAKSKEKREKRKREKGSVEQEEGGGSQGIVNSEESNKISVKIEVIEDNPEKKAAPIVGYFSSGYDPFEEEESKSNLNYRAKIYRNDNRNQKNPRMQVVVGVSGCRVNMVGTSYSGEAAMPQLCNYALGVFDKNTGTLKMVPIAANKIFRLDPKFDEDSDANQEKVNDELEGKAKEKATHSNLKDYLSKRDVRRDEKFNILHRTDDSGNPGDASEKLDGIDINTEAFEAIKSTVGAIDLPPYDMDALTVDRAYPLEKIILQGEWNHLQDIFDIVQAGFESTLEHYPTFVRNRIHELENIKDESKMKKRAGILSYITHLIKFKDRNSMEGVSSSKHHKLPSILGRKFTSMFGANTTNPKRMADAKQGLLVSYILVLSLFADEFRTDPSDIAKDLRIDPVTVRRHYEYLGCKFIRENLVLMATLTVPLEFKATRRKKRR